MARFMNDARPTLGWPTVAVKTPFNQYKAVEWAESDVIDGAFYCYSGWSEGELRMLFRFSDYRAATHFRLLFGGKIVSNG